MTSKPDWYKDLKLLPFHEKGFKEQHRLSVLQRISSKKSNKINKFILYSILSLTAIVVCFIMVSQTIATQTQFESTGQNEGFRIMTKNLNEEMWHVDAIVSGEVLETEKTDILDQGGLSNRSYSVDTTPAIIQVNEVGYGDVKTSTITLLQHGNAEDQTSLVSRGENLFLILVRTTNGEYWAYDNNNGVWTISDGKVFANDPIAPMDKMNGIDVNIFREQVTKAAQNKKKPAGIQ